MSGRIVRLSIARVFPILRRAGLACLLVLAGCGQPAYHIVRPGDTLYAISWRYARDYQELAEWNGLKPPYRLDPGQRIRLVPETASRPARTAALTRRPAVRRPVEAHALVPNPAPDEAARATTAGRTAAQTARIEPPKPAATAPIHWTWPSRARLVRGYRKGAEGVSGSGLDFSGKAGMPVFSAAAGRVVYSGQGIPSYGRLVIIKHSDEYLSAYAHNRRLLVKEGDRVRAGQKIAEMGASGTGVKGVLLHFEIRRRGRPVDPLRYLPARGR